MAKAKTTVAISGPVVWWGLAGLTILATVVIHENVVPKEKRWFRKLDNPTSGVRGREASQAFTIGRGKGDLG